MNSDRKQEKEILFIDSLYNRLFMENIQAVIKGASIGLVSSILLFKIKNRFIVF